MNNNNNNRGQNRRRGRNNNNGRPNNNGRGGDQVNRIDSRARGNAGLGLALVERIAKLHGAALVIESEEGAGTTVFIRFLEFGS